MSKLKFDGSNHQVSLIDAKGKTIGTWTAYNNVNSHATLTHLPNGTYNIDDTTAPHAHDADVNGPYGSYGIFRFSVPGHSGIGLHSGRANAKHKPGPQHPTMGCIRTTDDAMLAIKDAAASDALSTIEVMNNSDVAAVYGAARHGAHHRHHRHRRRAHAHA